MPSPSLRRRRPLVRLVAVLSAGAVVSGGLAAGAPPASAAPEPAPAALTLREALAAGGDLDDLPRGETRRAAPGRAALRTSAPPAAALRTAELPATRTATLDIRFVNTRGNTWSPQARAAFRAAADVWERSIESPVPIVVEATARSLGAGLLGGAAPYDYVRDEGRTVMRSPDRPRAAELRDDVFQPVALHNARTGRDALPPSGRELRPDIVADFNPNLAGLYLGTDGRPAPNQIDFRTVVLHEIAHGLGMTGTATVVDGRASVGFDDAVNGSTGVRSGVSFDQLTYTAPGGVGGTRVLALPDGSAALRAALTSDRLHWAGQHALTAAGGPVQLHAPALCGEQGPARRCLLGESPFVEGSAYSHLDERRYPHGSPQALMTPYLDEGEALAAPGQIALGMLADMGWTVPALAGQRFTATDSVRVLDTRTGVGAPAAALRAGGLVDLQVAGTGPVPATATAVVLRLRGSAGTAATALRAFPTPVTPSAEPEVADLVLDRGTTRAAQLTVPVGRAGRVRVRNGGGSAQLLADVVGWYGPSGASSLVAVEPVRLLDTRRGLGSGSRSPVGAGGQVDLRVTGVPAGTSAVVLTVTALGATRPTDVRVQRGGGPRAAVPDVADLHVSGPSPVVGQVVVRVGPDGTVRLRNAAGSVHLVADLVGAWSDTAAGSLFRAVTASRVLDTRLGIGTLAGTPARLGPAASVALRAGGATTVPRRATAVALTVTASGTRTRTDVRVDPLSAPRPGRVSQLSVTPGATVAESLLVRLGGGGVALRNSAGSVALTVTASGWFGPAA